jgi:hypothetical protein
MTANAERLKAEKLKNTTRRRWLVAGWCRLTGRWRQYVWAESAAAAIAGYCLEHGMEPGACQAEEVFELWDGRSPR